MPSILVINSNTSAAVGAILRQHVAAALPEATVELVLPRFGAAYVASAATYVVAGHAVLDAWAAWRVQHAAPPDGVIVGCFGDPGLQALREVADTRVTGLAEASFVAAARHGRFAVVTGGARWQPMLERLARATGYGDRLVGVHTVAATGGELAADRARALALLRAACIAAAHTSGVDAVILGGAGLAGLAAPLQPDVPVPLIDNVLAAAHYVLQAPVGYDRAAAAEAWQNLTPEMTALARLASARCGDAASDT